MSAATSEYTYTIEPGTCPDDGSRCWTVVQWSGETCLGGDRHWLTQTAAKRAMRAYLRGRCEHGETETSMDLKGAFE